jgi:hypothetical protein
MNTRPSPWLLTGMMLGSLAALALYAGQALHRAALLP